MKLFVHRNNVAQVGDFLLITDVGRNYIRQIIKVDGVYASLNPDDGLIVHKADSIAELLDAYQNIGESFQVIPNKKVEIHIS